MNYPYPMSYSIRKFAALAFVFLRPSRQWRRLPIALVEIMLLCSLSAWVQADDNTEYKVKAAYLYNFTKFIIWPKKNTETFNICIVGLDPFGNLLDALETKTALGKPIRLYRYDTLKQIQDCDIVYMDKVTDKEYTAIPGVLTVASQDKTLTVSSQPFFAEQGGMIGLAIEDEKVRLHINIKALKQNGLGISAKLIEVATLVEGGEHE